VRFRNGGVADGSISPQLRGVWEDPDKSLAVKRAD
jgi:hypothetical protein